MLEKQEENTDVERPLLMVKSSDGFESVVSEVVFETSSRFTLPMIVSKVGGRILSAGFVHVKELGHGRKRGKGVVMGRGTHRGHTTLPPPYPS